MDILSCGNGGRADCNNDGPKPAFFSMLDDVSSGGCGKTFENLDRPLTGVLGKVENIFAVPGDQPIKR